MNSLLRSFIANSAARLRNIWTGLKPALAFRLGIAVIILLAAALFSFLFIDGPLLDHMEIHPTDFHKISVVNAFRQLGKVTPPLWMLALWAFITRRTKAVTAAIFALIIVMPILFPIKYTVNRLRPEKVLIQRHHPNAYNEIHSGSPSFPSGDTASVFAVAAALAAFSTAPVAVLLYATAAGVGILRVVSLHHYPSDVFAGAVVGLCAGSLAVYLLRYNEHTIIKLPTTKTGNLIMGTIILLFPLIVSLFERHNPLLTFIKTFWPLLLIGFLIVTWKTYPKWIPSRLKQAQNKL